jgi:hypothetical protein
VLLKILVYQQEDILFEGTVFPLIIPMIDAQRNQDSDYYEDDLSNSIHQILGKLILRQQLLTDLAEEFDHRK